MTYCAFCTHSHVSLQDFHSRQSRGVADENSLIIVINNNRFDFIIRFFLNRRQRIAADKKGRVLFATLVTSALSN